MKSALACASALFSRSPYPSGKLSIRRIINITVSPGNSFENAQLLNYLTAPNVLVWSAASASCALPGLYESVQLMAKNQAGETVPYHVSNVTWTDGSLEHDLPINRSVQECVCLGVLLHAPQFGCVNPTGPALLHNCHRQRCCNGGSSDDDSDSCTNCQPLLEC